MICGCFICYRNTYFVCRALNSRCVIGSWKDLFLNCKCLRATNISSMEATILSRDIDMTSKESWFLNNENICRLNWELIFSWEQKLPQLEVWPTKAMTNYNKLCLNIISNISEKMSINKGEKYVTKYSNEILVYNMKNYEVCYIDSKICLYFSSFTFTLPMTLGPTLMIVALSSARV